MSSDIADSATHQLDQAMGFTLPALHARGRLVRLGPVLDQILAAHDYPAPIARVLSEALVLTGLLGSMLKHDEGQLTMQAQTENGIIDLLVCDYKSGELRGYVRFDKERLAESVALPSLANLFGKGYLAITFDQILTKERYQGIVPLEGNSLADAAQSYFLQSEQLPSLIRLAVNDTGHIAGGLLLQYLPEGEEGRERLHTRLDHPEWEHAHTLAATTKAAELTDPGLPLDQLLWRLFSEDEVRTFAAVKLEKGCRCNSDYIRGVLSRFGTSDLEEMADSDGFIGVDCEFCSRKFPISVADLTN